MECGTELFVLNLGRGGVFGDTVIGFVAMKMG